MTNERNPENNLLEDEQFDAALGLRSEAELTDLLRNIDTLHADLDTITIPDGEPVEAVIDVQSRLNIWTDKITRTLSLRQVKDTDDDLHNWDNEGGTVQQGTSRRLSSRMVNGERRLVWADGERIGGREWSTTPGYDTGARLPNQSPLRPR
jgi:hypothetical protein